MVWQIDRYEVNIKSNKYANKDVKRIVSEAKMEAYEDMSARLDTRKGEKYIHKLAKLRERRTRDVNQVECIKGRILGF